MKTQHTRTFFEDNEFDLLEETSGKACDRSLPDVERAYQDLRTAYGKVKYWADQIQKRVFPNGTVKINRRPTSQANKFDGYLWAKIYPTQKDLEDKWLAMTVGLNDSHSYEIKIDTVGLSENTNTRQKYMAARGDYDNSEIVLRHAQHKFSDWGELLEQTEKDLNSLKLHYPNIKALRASSEFFKEEITNTSNDLKINSSLNQILYGPPGTGKTYKTINKALEILGESTEDIERHVVKEIFERKIEEGRIVFTTFHQSMAYEDFIEGIKPVVPEKEGDPVVYKIEEGIFGKLCINAAFALAKKNESKEVGDVLNFSLDFDNLVQELEEELANQEIVELSTKAGGKVIVDSISQNGNILLKHHGGERTYTVSKGRTSKLHKAISNLNEVDNINDHFRSIIGGSNSTTYWAVLSAIRNKKKLSKALKKVERKYTWEEKIEVVKALNNHDYKDKIGEPFVLIIDEINRGNVSQIFGELITLIETDKRLGRPEALQVQLPYSKLSFGVPPNIYIIGTMNTADRSVEALDTALRRRFVFEEVMPKPELLEDIEFESFNLKQVLKIINERIEVLLDRDHAIGHSYFIKLKSGDIKGLSTVFKNNIIPLLQEYFYNDYEKIALVLGKGFVKEKKVKQVLFAQFDNIDIPETDRAYELITKIDDIVQAVQLLLKTSNE